MTRHKILLEHKATPRYINSTTAIVGVDRSVRLILHLTQDEYDDLQENLHKYLNDNASVCMALYGFTHGRNCSKHHKYKIWNEFEDISDIDFKYLGT